MQAITVKFLSPTNYRGARLIATEHYKAAWRVNQPYLSGVSAIPAHLFETPSYLP